MNKKSNVLLILAFASVVAFGLIIRNYVFSIRIIEGSSMSPLLQENDLVFVSMLSRNYTSGDIVIFNPPHSQNFILIKRIIAGPNSSFYINDYKIFVNELPVKTKVETIKDQHILSTIESPSSNLSYETRWKLSSLYCRYSEILRTGAQEYIVLGDNRCDSSDSRVFGAISSNNIVGKVVFIMPLASLFK
jgi:signal peptidase I